MVRALGDNVPSYQVVKSRYPDFPCGRRTREHAKGARRPQTVCI